MAARKWTDEQRQLQRDQCRRDKPWLKSTGAKTIAGKEMSAKNGFKGGETSSIFANVDAQWKRASAMFDQIFK